MTETKTKIRELFGQHFVAIFCQPVVTYHENVRAAQSTACVLPTVWLRRTRYLVISLAGV